LYARVCWMSPRRTTLAATTVARTLGAAAAGTGAGAPQAVARRVVARPPAASPAPIRRARVESCIWSVVPYSGPVSAARPPRESDTWADLACQVVGLHPGQMGG